MKVIPGSKKCILEFKESGNIYSLDGMKNIEKSNLRKSWIEEISNMGSIAELLTG